MNDNFFWVKVPDIQLLRTELDLRDVIYDEKSKITALKKLIIQDEKVGNPTFDKTGKSFLPVAPIQIYQHLLIS